MTFKQFFYENEKLELKTLRPITVTYKSVDGVIKQEIYSGPDAEQKARDFIDKWVGLNGEIGENANYIVANDGVGIVAVKGIDISDLLGREKPSPDLSGGYTKNLIRTTLLLNFPRFLSVGKLDDDSFIFDFKTGVMNKFRQKEVGRMIFSVRYLIDISEILLSLHIFTYFVGETDKKEYFKNFYFKPSRNFEEDLKTVESFFLEHESKIKETEKYINNDNAIQRQ